MNTPNNIESTTIKVEEKNCSPVKEFSEETNENLLDTLDKNNQNTLKLNYESLEKQIDGLMAGGKLIKLEKHYGEREVKQRLLEFSKKIQENPDRYWIFNSKWEFSLLSAKWKLIHKQEVLNLFKDSFSEYYKPNMRRALYSTATSVLPLISFL